jgi:peptide/nickel transport system substrate-binding protein
VIEIAAHDKYWDPSLPRVRKVIFDNRLMSDMAKTMRLCSEEEGFVDIVSNIRPLDTLKIAESPYAKVVKSRDVSYLNAWFNRRKKGSNFRDIRVRQALNHAINREELWRYAARGNAYNLEGYPIPQGAYGHNPHLKLYSYNPDLARALLMAAGFPNGFDVKIITYEACRLESQILGKMLGRIGLNVQLDVTSQLKVWQRLYIPMLDKPPEEEDWDISVSSGTDRYGNVGASWLPYPLIEESNCRWTEYDPYYEKMWKAMSRTVDRHLQEEKIRQLVKYNYDQANQLYIYSPLTLYAVNKEVNFIPQKGLWLRLKETSVTENHWSRRGKTN